MSVPDDHYFDLLQELKKRENQYSSIEVKGIIYQEDNVWKNVIMKFHPKASWEANISDMYVYNYNDVIIFSKNLSFEGR